VFYTGSRLGTPNELKELINVAHEMGIYVLMNVMHDGVSENALMGTDVIDRVNECYFRPGWRKCADENSLRPFDLTQ